MCLRKLGPDSGGGNLGKGVVEAKKTGGERLFEENEKNILLVPGGVGVATRKSNRKVFGQKKHRVFPESGGKSRDGIAPHVFD